RDAVGRERKLSGMYAALSFDDGKTWPVRRLITDDGPERTVDGGGNTRLFKLGPNSAEPRGYLAATQTPDGLIHLISSKQHYVFNLAWIKAPMPPEKVKK
ncbi:MAG: exo-alpha-sialidase, partial [Pirellulales bacterium]|nr:exo-alpha-sialidase [Pirellulales bacterium]